MKINDKVFGEMVYDRSWERVEERVIYGRKDNVRIVARAYDKPKLQEITEEQRQAYLDYQKREADYIKRIPAILLKFYLDNFDTISEYINIPEKINKVNINEEKIVKLIHVMAIFFDRKGRCGWLCNCAWEPDDGIAIIFSGDDIRIGDQSELI